MDKPKKAPPSGKHDFFERIGDEAEIASDQDENTWAVSFSDITTILLIFFIMLLSFSVINPNKFEVVQKAMKGANIDSTNIKQMQKQLEGVVQQNQFKNSIEISPNELGLNIEILDGVMFASGSARLNTITYDLLLGMVRELKALPKEYRFFIEGHTDDVPIRNTQEYLSNWHLSTARALSVLNIFSAMGIADSRLRVEGFADTQPLKEYPLRDKNNNPIPENRERNRRVVIKVR